MSSVLTTFLIGLFCVLFGTNLYFRFKVLKLYRLLSRHKVPFGISHIFSKEKMETDLIQRYPKHEKDIRLFISRMKRSILFALGIILLITIVALIMQLNNY